jgi:ribosomal protein L37AE/L43A
MGKIIAPKNLTTYHKEERMKIKNQVQERCSKCDSYIKEISPEIYGCDTCKKVINLQDNKYAGKLLPILI